MVDINEVGEFQSSLSMRRLLTHFLEHNVPRTGMLDPENDQHLLVVSDHSLSLPDVMEWITEKVDAISVIHMNTAQALSKVLGVSGDFERFRYEFAISALLSALMRPEGEIGGSNVLMVVSDSADSQFVKDVETITSELDVKLEIFKAPHQ